MCCALIGAYALFWQYTVRVAYFAFTCVFSGNIEVRSFALGASDHKISSFSSTAEQAMIPIYGEICVLSISIVRVSRG